MLKKQTLFFGFITLFLVCLVLCAGTKIPLGSNLPITERSFKMGFVPIPRQPAQGPEYLEAFEVLGRDADFILHIDTPDWKAFFKSPDAASAKIESLKFLSELSKRNGLSIYITINTLKSYDRTKISPNPFGKSFSEARLRSAFKNFVLRTVREANPQYLSLGSEINSYYEKNPKDFEYFISLYNETYDLVKQADPQIKIAPTFQYEQLSGTMQAKAQWDLLEKFSGRLDFIAVTTYPSLKFSKPEEMPRDYYSQIREYTALPVIFAESGWPCRGKNGSFENQANYLIRFTELTKKLKPKLWIYWFLHDWPPERGYPDFFTSMGLRTSDGKAKPAWAIWTKIHSLPELK